MFVVSHGGKSMRSATFVIPSYSPDYPIPNLKSNHVDMESFSGEGYVVWASGH